MIVYWLFMNHIIINYFTCLNHFINSITRVYLLLALVWNPSLIIKTDSPSLIINKLYTLHFLKIISLHESHSFSLLQVLIPYRKRKKIHILYKQNVCFYFKTIWPNVSFAFFIMECIFYTH